MVIELMAVHARTTLLKKLPDYDTKIVMINTAKKKKHFPSFHILSNTKQAHA